jgi:N4-gp56 family major capsid protein
MATQTTSTLSNEVKTYYDKVFLKRAEYELVAKEGAQMRTHSQNEGKTIWFNRYTPISNTPANCLLSEGENPAVSSITAANVSAVLAEYGMTVKISKFLTLTSIDKNNAEKIAVVGQHMGEVLNEITLNELDNSTARYGNGKASSAVAASDTLTGAELRRVVQLLEVAKAPTYEDNTYIGKFAPQTKTSLLLDSTWLNAKTYSDVRKLYNGEMGELFQVRCLLNKAPHSGTGTGAASTVTVYNNYIHGANAFGCFDLEGDKPKLHIVANSVDSGNPAGRFSLASWSGSYVAKLLNSAWSYVLKTPGAV